MRIERRQSNNPVHAWLASRGANAGMGTFINQSVPGPTPYTSAPDDTMSVLNKAKTALQSAGYDGVECHQETVYFPNGAGGSYVQNICSAPGYTGGSDANLVALMSPAQLAAQRAYEVAGGEGGASTPSYFQQTAGASNISIGTSTAPTTPSGGATNVAPDWFSTLQSQMNNISSQTVGAAAPPATPSSPSATQGTGGSNSTNSAANSSPTGGTLIPGVPDMYVYLGAAAAAFLLLKGGK